MDSILLLCGAGLALLFGRAGLAKWRGGAATAEAMRGFGLPAPAAAVLAPALPAAELAVAALLLLPRAAWAGAALALLLSTCFTALGGAALLRGQRPRCHCFGQAGAAPLGWDTVLRGAGCALAAALLLWAGPARLQQVQSETGATLLAALATLGAGYTQVSLAGLALATAALCWLTLNLLRQQGRLLLRIDRLEQRLEVDAAPPAGAPDARLEPGPDAPDFSAFTPAGDYVMLSQLLTPGKKMTLLFANADCQPCRELLPELLAWRAVHQACDDLLVVSDNGHDFFLDSYSAPPGSHLVLRVSRSVTALYGVDATPSALQLDGAGRIASPLAVGREAILEQMRMGSLDGPCSAPHRRRRALSAAP